MEGAGAKSDDSEIEDACEVEEEGEDDESTVIEGETRELGPSVSESAEGGEEEFDEEMVSDEGLTLENADAEPIDSGAALEGDVLLTLSASEEGGEGDGE